MCFSSLQAEEIERISRLSNEITKAASIIRTQISDLALTSGDIYISMHDANVLSVNLNVRDIWVLRKRYLLTLQSHT
jgi:hypothetical protein